MPPSTASPWHLSFTAALLVANLFLTQTAQSFTTLNVENRRHTFDNLITKGSRLNLFPNAAQTATIPKSNTDRDNQAFRAVKSAIKSPKVKDFPLIECEFPPLAALNKLGDGSLRSAREAEKANIAFATGLIKALSSPFSPLKTWIVTGTAASQSLENGVSSIKAASYVHSLRNGLPDTKGKNDICVLITPSTGEDYLAASKMAREGQCGGVIILNGFAKDTKSISSKATMAYYLKPLTYNSQVVGYLVRGYPGKWATIDAFDKKVLEMVDDDGILVKGTNTPDLRRSGKLVQKSVDDRAIRARKGLA